ncbi:hypothetical protein GCM10008986_17650 [Salinibacillus aidingensis]|uniref:Uncharacterized protein n=1 Tax=Salinibacillus aidingensis TaxID=237684 RepID=A0ABN1B8J4_9BACI
MNLHIWLADHGISSSHLTNIHIFDDSEPGILKRSAENLNATEPMNVSGHTFWILLGLGKRVRSLGRLQDYKRGFGAGYQA